jgi:hypothetical protein
MSAGPWGIIFVPLCVGISPVLHLLRSAFLYSDSCGDMRWYRHRIVVGSSAIPLQKNLVDPMISCEFGLVGIHILCR